MLRTLLLAATCTVAASLPAQHARLTVLHGIQGLPANVDVFANGSKLFDFAYGEQRGPLDLAAGTYAIEVRLNGQVVLSANPTLAAATNYSAIAHRRPGGALALTLFTNDVSNLPTNQSRLTVRHTADVGAVDVGLNQSNRRIATFRNLSNPNQVSAPVPSGGYDVELFPAGSTTRAFGPAAVNLRSRFAYFVYAVGSLTDRSFRLLIQTVDLDFPTLGIQVAGTTCGGNIGASTLAPNFAEPFSVTLSGAAPNVSALMLVGVNRQTLDLGPLGAPGCIVRNEAAIVLPATTDASGNASVTATVPAFTRTFLAPTYWQWAWRTRNNSLGFATTQQAELARR